MRVLHHGDSGEDVLLVKKELFAKGYYPPSVKEIKSDKESKSAYAARTKDIKHPLVEKLFNEYAPRYKERNDKQNQGGGYTRILRMGQRRGDDAELAIIELV